MKYRHKILDKKTVYQGFFRLDRYRIQHELFAGGWTQEIERELFERGHAAAVLPYDPELDQVVLIEQFRMGAIEAPDGPWLLEIVAGIVEPNETEAEVARRETLEEAGRQVLDLMPICQCYVSPGGSTETLTLFCARVNAGSGGSLHGLDDEHEDIRVHVFSRREALELLRSARIHSAPAIIALQWLELHIEEIHARWRCRPIDEL